MPSNSAPQITWPDTKKFAFTIFDDTDYATLTNVPEVYAFLGDLGFRTTKSVWPIRGAGTPICGGDTCENRVYLQWVLQLKSAGFEIGYHLATYHTSLRADTIKGLDRFRELFGQDPSAMANHSACRENLYWGSARLTGLNRTAYNVLTGFRYSKKFRGHIEGDELFWGDLCRDRIRYVRNFVYPEINTLKACPIMPYHDPNRPYVKEWFASSEGPTLESFLTCLSESNQDRLESEGGACIMYTHLASGFYVDGKLNARFRELMTRLSRKGGWFVPVSTLLDYIVQERGAHTITAAERSQLERRWLRHKLFRGRS
ncbi:MAG TPA: hypothetical protein VMS71_00145 [Candidatus Acidoferrum sp.]|nr:hypothetical protein [Candidatus Acidoferrum sp.]